MVVFGAYGKTIKSGKNATGIKYDILMAYIVREREKHDGRSGVNALKESAVYLPAIGTLRKDPMRFKYFDDFSSMIPNCDFVACFTIRIFKGGINTKGKKITDIFPPAAFHCQVKRVSSQKFQVIASDITGCFRCLAAAVFHHDLQNAAVSILRCNDCRIHWCGDDFFFHFFHH